MVMFNSYVKLPEDKILHSVIDFGKLCVHNANHGAEIFNYCTSIQPKSAQFGR